MKNPGDRADPARSALARLDALATQNPEWAPWLCVVREVVAELSNPAWDAHLPETVGRTGQSPLLAGAVLQPHGPKFAHLLDRLSTVARAQGLGALAGPADRDPTSFDEASAIFLAAINGDGEALDRQASRAGAALEGWRAFAQLLPMPYLHSCSRRWIATIRSNWSQGFCPVCGAWPAFAEMRGIQRSRHLCCGRCGSDWPMPILACTYCATSDHDALSTLVVDNRTARWAIDVCRACSSYLKTFATLQPTPPNEIVAADLTSVEFDLAAVERGFRRPQAHGIALCATLAATADPVHTHKRWWS